MGMTEDLTNLVVVNLETGVKEKITVYQYDTARCIIFQFINVTEIFNLTGKTARIYMNKPDGELIFNDLETVSEEEGKASILLDENMLAATGTMYCDITIYEGDKTISVPKFCINIMKPLRNDRSITSTAEYRALTDALANVDDFKTKVDIYNTYLEKLGTASPKGAFDSLDDIKAAYPLGDDSVYLVDVDGNYYVAIYEDGEWETKFPYLTDELNFLVDDLNERFNNAINATTTDTEVIDARHDSINNITYTTLSNRLKAIDDKVSNVDIKKQRVFTPKFGVNPYWGQANNETGSYYSQTLERMKLNCDKYEELGLDTITVPLHIARNSTNDSLYVAENTDSILNVITYLEDKNVKINCIKVHTQHITLSDCADFTTKYKTLITSLLTKFQGKGITYFLPFNEQEVLYNNETTYKDWIIEVLALCQNYGFKTGITTAGWSLAANNDYYEASDVICANLYPSMGKKGSNTTIDDINNAFEMEDRIKKIKYYHDANPTKKLIVSEIGIQDYWIALQAPSYYSWNESDKVATNGEAPNLLLNGVFENLNKSYIEEVWWWFDLYYTPTKATCLKYLNGGE